MEKQVKELEDSFKQQVVELMNKTDEQERELEARKVREAELQQKWQEEEKKLREELGKKMLEEITRVRAIEQEAMLKQKREHEEQLQLQ